MTAEPEVISPYGAIAISGSIPSPVLLPVNDRGAGGDFTLWCNRHLRFVSTARSLEPPRDTDGWQNHYTI